MNSLKKTLRLKTCLHEFPITIWARSISNVLKQSIRRNAPENFQSRFKESITTISGRFVRIWDVGKAACPHLEERALYKRERQMYPAVINWLRAALKNAHRGYRQRVFNTSRTKLQALIEQEGLQNFFPLFPTYEVTADVTAILKRGRLAYLGFVECKLNPILLKDIGQLWGYAKVAQPLFALIVSPSGVSEAVRQLLQVHQRYEILDYAPDRKIRVAIWDSQRGEVVPKSVIPPGGTFI